MSNRTNVIINAGDIRTLTFTARDYANNVINLDGAEIRWRVGTRGQNAIIQKEGTIVNAANGTFSVSLSEGDTLHLRERDYEHMATVQVGGAITTAVRGRFRVLQGIHAEVA